MTLTVHSCARCPLVEYQPGAIVTRLCRAKRLRAVEVPRGTPAWCPLRTGDVTVQLKRVRRL